jgi:ribosomal RNA-processing protein 36
MIQVQQEWRTKEKAAVAAGKKEYYLKDSEKKKLVLAKKFEKLEAEGKLEKYIQKRRKRSSAKDHKKLPFRVR